MAADPNTTEEWQAANHAWQKWLDVNIPDWDAMPNVDLTTLPTQKPATNTTIEAALKLLQKIENALSEQVIEPGWGPLYQEVSNFLDEAGAAVTTERDRSANIAIRLGKEAGARGIGNLRLEYFAQQIAAEIRKG